MNKIGIIYICTGNYVAFWEDFYKSFEDKFLNESELHYFVFTDADSVYDSEKNIRIHMHYLGTQPWPLVTLFRFKTFLSIEDELKEMDYLMFSNANMECVEKITEEEFLPRIDKGEKLFAAIHPGYAMQPVRFAPMERHRRSYAYVPYNIGKKYVIGAMNGGTTDAFLEMAHTLDTAIDEDLKKNVIARWHDESHLNRYIANRQDCRLLSPEYCFPFGMDVTYKPKIAAVSKIAKFDVDKFKGVDNTKKKPLYLRVLKYGSEKMKIECGFLFDFILRKKVREYDFK